MIMRNTALPLWIRAFQYFILPLLGAIYPAMFHYANNAEIVDLSSFRELCLFLAAIGLVIYILLVWFSRGMFPHSAVGALLVLVFFYTYGFAFDRLRSTDIFQIETYSFIPFWIFAGLYLAWFVTRLSSKLLTQVWNGSMLILGGLILFNVIQIAPVAFERNKDSSIRDNAPVPVSSAVNPDKQYPDIYYLVFDEAAGFEAIRQYWNYPEVDNFAAFLESNGFYVAENSHGHSISTLYEISTRLYNPELPLPPNEDKYELYNSTIGHNFVTDFLKDRGYTLIAYDQKRYYLTTLSPLPVDHLFEESPEEFVADDSIQIDDYQRLVLENTLIRSLLNQSDQDPRITLHKNMILYTAENVASTQFSSPKFVFVHLLLPHVPFVFKENGDLQLEGGYANWQKYLQNYKFFLNIAPQMVENILAASDPDNPPVIVLQSDHGARNITNYPYSGFLEDYPKEYKSLIVNALHLPNCDNAPLSQDMDPVNTFPIIFNCYFEANIPLR